MSQHPEVKQDDSFRKCREQTRGHI